MSQIYLDHAASTPMLPQVYEFYCQAIHELYANPHADHGASHNCQRKIKTATMQILNSAHAKSAEIIYTSGGTEANNIAILGSGLKEGDEVLVPASEHPSVINPVLALQDRGVKVSKLAINEKGLVTSEVLEEALSKNVKLVIFTALQNELGIEPDLKAYITLTRKLAPKAIFHIDNVQGFGKRELFWDRLKPDSMSIAGHKFHGPNSIGALICRRGLKLESALKGAGQQNGLRPGTQDAAAISGLGFAAAECMKLRKPMLTKAKELNELCREGLENLVDRKNKAVELVIHSDKELCSPYTLMFSLKGFEGSILMRALSAEGIFVGVGSACSAETKEPNKTLTAMGVDQSLAYGAIRVSFSYMSEKSDIEGFLKALQEILKNY